MKKKQQSTLLPVAVTIAVVAGLVAAALYIQDQRGKTSGLGAAPAASPDRESKEVTVKDPAVGHDDVPAVRVPQKRKDGKAADEAESKGGNSDDGAGENSEGADNTKSPNDPATDGDSPASKDAGTDNDAGKGTLLSKETIKEAISMVRPQLKSCYEKILMDFPTLEGDVVVTFDIVVDDGTAHVDLEQVAEDSELHEKELHQCLLDALRTAEFKLPKGTGDGAVSVKYPFRFKKAEEPGAPDAGVPEDIGVPSPPMLAA